MADLSSILPNQEKRCPKCKATFVDFAGVLCPHDKTRLVFAGPDPLVGQTVAGSVKILQEVAEGSWGKIYRCQDIDAKQTLALKVLHPHLVTSPEKVKRFQREGESVQTLDHPNIARVLGVGFLDNSQPFIKLEYLVGRSLEHKLVLDGALPVREAIRIAQHCLHGLQHAHEHGIIHRDVKPNNIFLCDDGTIKLLDFGLAKIEDPSEAHEKLTLTGQTMGTPDYMSPEQCQGLELDGRSDLYSLSCVLYEMLTGQRPVAGTSVFDAMQKHINKQPPAFEQLCPQRKIDPRLEEIVFRGLSKDRNLRFADAAEYRQALDDFAGETDPGLKGIFRRLFQ